MTDLPKKRRPGFQPGQSGNPAGRPKGIPSRSARLLRALTDADVSAILKSVLKQAKDGNVAAARLLLDKIMPNARERAVELPGLPSTENPAGVAEAQAAILQAVASGDLTPGEAATLSGIVENRRKAIETQELEQRIRAIEQRQ